MVLPDAVDDIDTSRVGGRNLLVIGSQCESLPKLSFLPDVATKLYEAMTDPERGACQSALDPSGLVIDPTVAEAKKAIRTAFERAANDEATLLLAVIGHGEQVTEDGDFYFLPTNAEVPPAGDTALNLVNHVKDLRRQHETDGLVVLVDTCYSGTGAVAAGKAWPSMSLGEFRFEFLAATADRPAFDGCFSKSLIQWVQRGMSGGLGDLRCEMVRMALADRCPNQRAQHVSYQSDPGLFLAHNLAPEVAANPAAGTPSADNAERLTAWFQPTGDLERAVEFSQRHPLVAVVGDAGAGKSAIAAALIRPEVAPRIVPPRFAQAVVFASESSTPTQVAMDLSGQLGRSVPGFTDLARAFQQAASEEEWNSFNALHRQVVGPLTLHESAPVRIVIDAIDQLPEESSAPLRAALPVLADMGVRIVVTARPDAWLPERTEQDFGACVGQLAGRVAARRPGVRSGLRRRGALRQLGINVRRRPLVDWCRRLRDLAEPVPAGPDSLRRRRNGAGPAHGAIAIGEREARRPFPDGQRSRHAREAPPVRRAGAAGHPGRASRAVPYDPEFAGDTAQSRRLSMSSRRGHDMTRPIHFTATRLRWNRNTSGRSASIGESS